jgi:hypothetical protein
MTFLLLHDWSAEFTQRDSATYNKAPIHKSFEEVAEKTACHVFFTRTQTKRSLTNKTYNKILGPIL